LLFKNETLVYIILREICSIGQSLLQRKLFHFSTRQADNFQYVSYFLTGRPTNFRQSIELSWWTDITTEK